MGNRSFREKRGAEQGFRNSPLRLNADLRQTERWDETAIRARGARLADLAVDIWRRPVLTDRVLTSYETPRADAGRYTIEHHPHLRPGAPMHDLFEAVRQAILALGPQVREEFRRHYVAYKTQTNFVDVVPQKRRLLLSLNMRFDEFGDRLHDLRHTHASHAVMNGVPVPVVSRLLGHSDVRTTLRYAHLGDKEVEEAAERVGQSIAAIMES